MPVREYAVDGDQGFIGLNSRDNPVNLGKNFVSKSVNFRFDRGVANLRKGAERLTVISGVTIYGSCSYTTAAGVEMIVLVVSDGLYTYTPDTDALSIKVGFPIGETITSSDEVDVYQAQASGYVYILRGFSKTVLRWNGSYGAGNILAPGGSAHHNYPNSRHAIYYGNRHIVQTDSNTFQVSHYLEDDNWSSLDMFSINDGGNDRLVALSPWTLNEFVVFMRNSVFYASVGAGAVASGDPAQMNDSYVKSLATDIGCIAKDSVVQAGGGILFLSDNGVYFLNPAGASAGQGNTPEGMRLLTLSEPLSAPISDVIERINYNYVSKAVAVYWENRYYLAVPLDSSTTNNAILVYNFINKAWESVDSYPAGVDILNFAVAKKGSRRRLFAVDKDLGVYLMEELDYDEYGTVAGLPILPFYLPSSPITGTTSFDPIDIQGELVTRAYSFDTNREKRFSSIQTDVYIPSSGAINVQFITSNPDVTTNLITKAANGDEDFILRVPTRKTAYYAQVKFLTTSKRPSVRSVTIEAVMPGHNTQTTQ
jgi:hypothetical protein